MAAFLIQLLQTDKPDSVFRLAADGYHLSGCCIAATILLPTLPAILQKQKCKRAAYNAFYGKPGFTWHCSTQGLPMITITYNHRELLPHVFTLIPIKIGTVIFCGTIFPVLRLPKNRQTHDQDRLLTGVLLYTVRTFLPFAKSIGTITWLAASTKLPI